MERLTEMVRLHRMGSGPREVARLLGISPNTERKYRTVLRDAALLAGDPGELPPVNRLREAIEEQLPAKAPPQQVSSAMRWADPIREMLARDAGPRAIYDALRLRSDEFTASYSAVKRFCRRMKEEEGIRPEEVVIPVETDPGEVLQVDFTYAGKLYDPAEGRMRRTWAFVGVLGFSRFMDADLVFDQRVETWLDLHSGTFAALQGVVETVVPDNLKAAVVRAAFGVGGPTTLNRSYRELARHYGFKVDPTPPRSPEKKGKVESGAKYLKRSFLRPRGEMEIPEARRELGRWLKEVANERIHGTTGRRPRELLEEVERARLLRLPDRPYEPVVWKEAKVHRDSHVLFKRRFYSVPWRLIGKKVLVRATRSQVMVFADEERVAVHPRKIPGVRSTVDSHLPDRRSDYRHRSRAYWERRAAGLGPPVLDYVREVFDSDDVLCQLRTVQAVVTHLEEYPEERAQAACARALHFGNLTYRGIKSILRKGLDLVPVTEDPGGRGRLASPRYARRPGELFRLAGGEG